jgi:hypothetical protein
MIVCPFIGPTPYHEIETATTSVDDATVTVERGAATTKGTSSYHWT